jgi:hypothetical protein
VGFFLLFLTSLNPYVLDLVGSAVYVLTFPFVASAATLLFFDLKQRRGEAVKPATDVAIDTAG